MLCGGRGVGGKEGGTIYVRSEGGRESALALRPSQAGAVCWLRTLVGVVMDVDSEAASTQGREPIGGMCGPGIFLARRRALSVLCSLLCICTASHTKLADFDIRLQYSIFTMGPQFPPAFNCNLIAAWARVDREAGPYHSPLLRQPWRWLRRCT